MLTVRREEIIITIYNIEEYTSNLIYKSLFRLNLNV